MVANAPTIAPCWSRMMHGSLIVTAFAWAIFHGPLVGTPALTIGCERRGLEAGGALGWNRRERFTC
jgi:hypothetical protein